MSRSVLYAANTSTQTVPVGRVVSFGSIVHRYGCGLGLSGGNAITKCRGYYAIDTNFTLTTETPGAVTITLYKNGVEILGANAITTVALAGTESSITIPAEIRQCCDCDAVITAEVSGTAATISNAAIRIEKD